MLRHTRMRHTLLLGSAGLAATALLSLAVTGVASTQLTGGVLRTPTAAADELQPFRDCEALRQWYVDQTLPLVGPYGVDGGPGIYPVWQELDAVPLGGAFRAAQPSAGGIVNATGSAPDALTSSPDHAVQSSQTGTNVQEADVDEPDRAKTDGHLLVRLDGRGLVVTDVTGAEPRELGRLRLPADLADAELLLAGDRVFVVGSPVGVRGWPELDTVRGGPLVGRIMPPGYGVPDRTRLLTVSLADPTSPTVESDRTFGGELVSARQYGDPGAVRLVVRTGSPAIDFVAPNRNRTEREATQENKRLVRDSALSAWLPTVTDRGGATGPLVDCGDVRHPRTGAGLGTLTVVTFPTDDPSTTSSTAVTAAGDVVYSSRDRLYLATTTYPEVVHPGLLLPDASASTVGPDVAPDEQPRTELHAFALDGTATRYVASGDIAGTVKDRWSLDVSGGFLRVVVTHGPGWTPTESGLVVLAEDGGDLRRVGSVTGLGRGEEVKAVRFYDDLAVVVTFRQTDPLYTVDLSDPTAPRTRGALKIPGFSTYLHPLGGDRLLGLGQDADARGTTRGGQASTFDVADLDDPRRVDRLGLGAHADPVAGWEPRTFTWLPGDTPGSGTALAALNDDWSGRSRVVALGVAADGSLTETGSWALPRWRGDLGRALPLPDGRVAIVGQDVRLVTPVGP